MWKLLILPLLFINVNAKKEVNVKTDYQKSRPYLEKIREKENGEKAKLFIKNLEYQLLYDSLTIDYNFITCFNHGLNRIIIKKHSQGYTVKLYAMMGLELEILKEKYEQDKWDKYQINLSSADMELLKMGLVENKKIYSTFHNYIGIKQGPATYELWDDNPSPPIFAFIKKVKLEGRKI